MLQRSSTPFFLFSDNSKDLECVNAFRSMSLVKFTTKPLMPEFRPGRAGRSLAIVVFIEPVFSTGCVDYFKAVERTDSPAAFVLYAGANDHAKRVIEGSIISLYLLEGQRVANWLGEVLVL